MTFKIFILSSILAIAFSFVGVGTSVVTPAGQLQFLPLRTAISGSLVPGIWTGLAMSDPFCPSYS